MPRIRSFESGSVSYVKWHGLRALCGLLMDRHSACDFGPFCGSAQDQNLIVHAIPQSDPRTDELALALYFSRATWPSVEMEDGELIDLHGESGLLWVASWQYAGDFPHRKAVVQPLDDGTYYAEYGQIANPTKGDYSTGRLDREEWTFEFRCDPEPAWSRSEYWPLRMSTGQRVVPEFRCLQLRGEWWIFDIDRERRMVGQVAALTVADNPNHTCRSPR